MAVVQVNVRTTSLGSWMVAATAVPWVAALALGDSLTVTEALATIGTMHVGITAAFYGDPATRSIIRSDPRRYLWAPAVFVAVGVAAALTFPPTLLALLVLARFGWSMHHFNRQNLGVLSMWTRAHNAEGLTADDRRAIDLAGVGAIVAACTMAVNYGPHLERFVGPIAEAGPLLAALVLGVSAFRLRSRPRLLAAVVFWLPLIVFHSKPSTALLMVGLPHAAQYYLLMAGMTRNRVDGMRIALILAASVLALGTVHELGAQRTTPMLYGVFLGLGAAHFVIDAGIWRMRDPQVREYWRGRFPFL